MTDNDNQRPAIRPSVDPSGRLHVTVPDIYETRQIHAITQAMREGDPTAVSRLVAHLMAEADLDDEGAQLISCSLLFRQAQEDLTTGHADRAARTLDVIADVFPTRTVRTVIASSMLIVGAAQGFLDPGRYDQLAALLKDTNANAEQWRLFDSITRTESGGQP